VTAPWRFDRCAQGAGSHCAGGRKAVQPARYGPVFLDVP
jgi:hypothetical protein